MSHNQVYVIHCAKRDLSGFIEASVTVDHCLIHVQDEALIPARSGQSVVNRDS